MSKLSFRARALDATKSMPIYDIEDLPDLSDYAAANRSVPQMPTGMEKEEEMELHLQQVLSARDLTSIASSSHTPPHGIPDSYTVTIPVPKVQVSSESEYCSVYGSNSFILPKHYIKMQAAFNLEPEFADYDQDSEDETWITSQNTHGLEISSSQFERMMDRLEKQSEHQVVKLEEAKRLLEEDDDVISAVYDYWLDKRHKSDGSSLLPQVRTEKRDGTQASNNPYIAFRRRAEKMQTRKNRKNDEESYEKMLRVRSDLRKAVTLLEMIKRREKTKREILNLSIEVFERRYQLEDWSDEVYSQLRNEAKPMFQFSKEEIKRNRIPHSPARKRNHLRESANRNEIVSAEWLQNVTAEWYRPTSFPGSSFSLREAQRIAGEAKSWKKAEEESLDGEFTFKRRRGCLYFAPRSEKAQEFEGTRPFHTQPIRRRANWRYTHLYLHARERLEYVGLARRRVGRGGRVLVDRVEQRMKSFNPTGSFGTSQANVSQDAFRPASPMEFEERDCLEEDLFASVLSADGKRQVLPLSVGASADLYELHKEQVDAWIRKQILTVCAFRERRLERAELIDSTQAWNAVSAVMTPRDFAQLNAEVGEENGGRRRALFDQQYRVVSVGELKMPNGRNPHSYSLPPENGECVFEQGEKSQAEQRRFRLALQQQKMFGGYVNGDG